MTRSRERALVGATIVLVPVALAIVFPALLARPLWLDEVHTLMVASRATPAAVISDVAAGIDTAPGLLHLMWWVLVSAFGESPVVLRALTFAAASGAHWFVYLALRRRFGVLPSAAGTLAVATHLLVIQMSFEARAYAPWLFAAAAFAWSLGCEPGRRRDILVALFAVLLCMVHWFGVVTLGIMCAAVVVLRRDRAALRSVAPASAGMVALLSCIPILLSQRRAVTAQTWVPSPDAQQLWEIARVYYVALVPVLAAVILAARFLRENRSAEPSTGQTVDRSTGYPVNPSTSSVIALASLGLFPVAMAVFSYVVQPSLVDRYLLVAVLAWAPLVAFAVATLRPRVAALIVLVLIALGAMNYRTALRVMDGFGQAHAQWVAGFSMAVDSSSLPVVFQSRHVQFPTLASHPRGRERAFFLWLPDSTITALFPGARFEPLARFFIFEREAAELHFRRNRFPRLATQAQLDTTRAFLLFGNDASLPATYKDVERFAHAIFPHHRVYRLHPEIALLQRD